MSTFESETETTLVDSSFIVSLSYSENNLDVEFKNGNIYRYLEVPEKVYENLKDSSSVGTAFNNEILEQYDCKFLGTA